jgi:lipoprotein-anchoring transpeptidase ErfK/SrfK
MIRAFAFLFAALTVLAGVGHAQAQERTFYDIFGGGPNFGGGGYGGSSPIQRSTVSFAGGYAPGTIYINTAERRLYLVLGNGQALRYGIGVGRDGFRWSGTHRISAKKEWPSWTPPSQMLRRRPDLPRHMRGGNRQPARRARDVSGIDALSYPRLQRARDDRTGGVLRMFSHDQRGRDRPL